MIDNKRTQKEWDEELRNDRIAEKEHEDTQNKLSVQKIMEVIENRRKKHKKKYSIYTQEYLAKRSGICIATYKNYLSGKNANLTAITLIKMAKELKININDISKLF